MRGTPKTVDNRHSKPGRQITTALSQNNQNDDPEEVARSERVKINSANNIRHKKGRIIDPEDEEVISYQNDQAEDVFDDNDYGQSEDSDEESKVDPARAGANPGGRYKGTSSLILQQDKTKNPRSEFSGTKNHRPYGDSITVGQQSLAPQESIGPGAHQDSLNGDGQHDVIDHLNT